MADEGSALAGNPEDIPGGDGGDGASWAGNEYQDLITAKGWGGVDDALKSYVNLESTVGGDKITLPVDGADIAEWDGWEKLGVPAEATDYKMDAPQGYNGYDTGLADDMRVMFHDAKLQPWQVEKLHDGFVERAMGQTQNAIKDSETKLSEWDTEIKAKYGTAYDERIAAGNQAVAQFGGDDLKQWLVDTGAGRNPVVIDAFVRAGMALGQSGQFKDGAPAGFGTTPQDAKDQIATLRANPALIDKAHPEYGVLNEKLEQLHKAAFGEDVVLTVGQP